MNQLPEPQSPQPGLPVPRLDPTARNYPVGTYPVGADADPPTGLLEYWYILRRHKGTVILIAFAGLVFGILFTLPQTPVYQARTSLEIQDINQDFMNLRQVSTETQTYSALTDVQTQIKILQSESLIGRTVAKLKLAKPGDLKPEPSRFEAWRQALNLAPPPSAGARDQLLSQAGRSMKVRAAGQTRIIEVLVDSTDRQLAADFANTIANEFIDQNTEARWKMSQRTGDWLGRQLDDMRIKLERSEDGLQRYARQAGLVFTGGDKKEQTNVSEDKLRQVQQALTAASADRVAKQSRYEMAASSAPDTLPDVLNDSALREYQTKLTDLRRQMAEISATYTPEYSKVKRLQAQVQTLESALERERQAIISRIKNEYDEALRREKLLSADYAAQSRVITSEAEKAIQYNILKREVDSNRQLYEAMLQRVKESAIASALKASNVRVVDAAQVPGRPYKPNLPMNGALGLFAGAFAAVAFVVMRDRANRTLQAPGDAPLWLNIPELGIIPSKQIGARRYLYTSKNRKLEASEPGDGTELAPVPSVPPALLRHERTELMTLQKRSSAMAEAFRMILTSILFSGENGSRPRVLVMTSSGPGEGKTTVACNLAVALTEIGRKVLLIDADLRKPRVHAIFELDNTRGLADMLRNGDTVPLQETALPGLSVLPSGPPTSSAANLLFASRMPELLARYRSEFDMILIDTPPMLEMPDARILGRLSDAVLLVTRANHTTRDAALAAQHRFSDDQTRVLGTILNDWDPRNSPAGYYGYYSRYHNYGYREYSTRVEG